MRLFIAIPLTSEVRTELMAVVGDLCRVIPMAKWVKAENLHLTLKFLGAVSQEQVPEIIKALNEVGRQEHAFDCFLTRFGTFPAHGQPRVLYVATDQQLRLSALVRTLEGKLAPLGFASGGRFMSHITLARFHKGNPLDLKPLLASPINFHAPFAINGISFIDSQLGPQGAFYTELHRAAFLT